MSAEPIYLQPTNINSEVDDQELRRFLQQVTCGLTGLDGTLVFPRWQPEPPNYPAYGTTWCSVGTTARSSDTFSFVRMLDDGNAIVFRQQVLSVLNSFYGPAAEITAEKFSMGLQVDTNRAVLTQAGYGLVAVEDFIVAPTLVSTRNLYSVDVHWRVRRSQTFNYAVLSITAAEIVLYNDTGIPPITIPISNDSYGINFKGNH